MAGQSKSKNILHTDPKTNCQVSVQLQPSLFNYVEIQDASSPVAYYKWGIKSDFFYWLYILFAGHTKTEDKLALTAELCAEWFAMSHLDKLCWFSFIPQCLWLDGSGHNCHQCVNWHLFVAPSMLDIWQINQMDLMYVQSCIFFWHYEKVSFYGQLKLKYSFIHYV